MSKQTVYVVLVELLGDSFVSEVYISKADAEEHVEFESNHNGGKYKIVEAVLTIPSTCGQ